MDNLERFDGAPEDHIMKSRSLPLLLVALVAALLAGAPARAATVSIAPSDTTVNVGDEFWLRATIDPFPDLKGCDLIWGYTSARLDFLASQAGDVIAGGGSYFDFVLPDVAAPADSVWYDAALLAGSSAGPGNIVFLKFKATLLGDALVSCLFADLRDSNNQSTLPACTGGVIHILDATPSRRASWGSLKTLYR